jgi:hypothetical protein
MAEQIQALFCDPPIAVARLGGSTAPLECCVWEEPPNPRADGATVLVPDWSLNVLPDGSIEPHKANTIRFRDGPLIRPVCPFVEIWVRLGEPGSDPSTWRDVPLTPALLTAAGTDASALRFTVDARNRKAARRRRNLNLAYGTFPFVTIRGDQHQSVPLVAVSPPGVAQPLIPSGRSIPIGSIQVLRGLPGPPTAPVPWPARINLEVIRIRFTPAAGLFYGPPAAAQPTNESPIPAVREDLAFLNPLADWFGQPGAANPSVEPGDTFDETAAGSGTSLGVVDDTCEALIDVTLQLPGMPRRTLTAHANVFVGPPDFGPDRRPFLSLADELNDRTAGAAARNASLTADERDAWVQDLFERVQETISLMNLDFWRRARGINPLSADGLSARALVDDGALPPQLAMGSQDKLRNPLGRVAPVTADVPLPVTERARERHRSLASLDALKGLVAEDPDRMRTLVRAAFEVDAGEDGNSTSMRMPPFMRHSNALPLTLSAWQYDLLMQWIEELTKPPAPAPVMVAATAAAPSELSARSAARRDAVLRRIG